jgi:hypothetical protein
VNGLRYSVALRQRRCEHLLRYFPSTLQVETMAPRSRLIAIHPVHGYAITPQQDLKTIKRNARERNRVQAVNSCFENLRRRVPSAAVYKKMSKVNIIHHALEYIHQLTQMLNEEPLSVGQENTLFPSASYPFHHPSNTPASISSSSSSFSSSHTWEWAMRSQAAHFLSSPFLTPNALHSHHHLPLMDSPNYMQCSPSPMGVTNSPALSTPSEGDSCHTRFPQFSPVTPPSPAEEDDVLDAIVEWQSC